MPETIKPPEGDITIVVTQAERKLLRGFVASALDSARRHFPKGAPEFEALLEKIDNAR